MTTIFPSGRAIILEIRSSCENSPEKITTNILASRLKKLVTFSIVEKTLYQEKPKRYTYGLTDKGKCLIPVLLELVKWGEAHIDDPCDHQLLPPPYSSPL